MERKYKVIVVRFFLFAVFIGLSPNLVFSQQESRSQLLSKWDKYIQANQAKPDTSVVNLLNDITLDYMHTASDSAFYFAQKALSMSKALKYEKGKATAYAYIAKIHYTKGNYDLSLSYALTALGLSSHIDYKTGIAYAHNTMGVIHIAQKKYALALQELMKAATLNATLKNQTGLSGNYFNVGLCYLEMKSDSAIHYFLLSREISIKIPDQHLVAMANNHLGEYYLQKGKLNTAISFYSSILENRNYQNDWEDSFAHTGLAKCYYAKGNYKEAIDHSQKGYLLAKKSNTKWDIEKALGILYLSYSAVGDSKNAYKYLLLDKIYSDSLFNESKEKEINALYLKQKQAENEVLKKKNQIAEEKEASQRMLIVVIVLIAILLMIIAITTYRNAERIKRLYKILQRKTEYISTQNELIEQKNDALNESNQTKDRLFSIIGHDLRSPFASMRGALELFNSGMFDEDEKQMMLDRVLEQMTVTSAMLENLLSWANSQREGLKTNIEPLVLTDLINEILAIFKNVAIEKNIVLTHVFDSPVSINADQDQMHVVFRNLVTNAIKFTKPNGEIFISYLETDKSVKVLVKDNGVGMSEDKLKLIFQESGKSISTYGTRKEKGIGIGLMLVKKFVELNHATITVESKEKEGTVFIVEFMK